MKSIQLPNIEDMYPLTPMQQGMLFHSLYASAPGMYLNQLGCCIEGDFDPKAFRQAWERVVQRHAILRTSFLCDGVQEPMQVVRRKVELPWQEENWTNLTESSHEDKWQQLLHDHRQRSFNLKQAPLLRFALIRKDESNYYFSWTYHHILLDGWCQHIVLQEVFRIYEAARLGKNLQLDEPGPYRRYIGWLQKQDQEKAKEFWRSELAGFSAPTPLGIESSAGVSREDEAAIAESGRKISPQLTAQLDKLARQHKVTLNTVVQAAWGVLLSSYNGEHDVVFGATVSGRSAALPGIESMLGLFINTLPVRIKLNQDETIAAYLRRIQQRQAEARAYEYSPLLKVQEWSDVPRGTPLFSHILVFENLPVDAATRARVGESMKINGLDFFEITNFPFVLTINPGPELSFRCNFNLHQFTSESIERMFGHLELLLQQMAEQPQQQIGNLSLIGKPEQQQILTDWNRTDAGYPEKCIHELFEKQVDRTPTGLALMCAGRQATYEELDRRSNQLAHYLRTLRLENEACIGVCLERSLDQVTAMLASMKAGGIYVPLDPESPLPRLQHIVKDAGIEVILTITEFANHPCFSGQSIVCLDAEREMIERQDHARLTSVSAPDRAAYVIYTSGSTGKPKGVLGLHRGAVNRCSWMWQKYPFAANEVSCQKTSIGFVDSISELLVPLLYGVPVAVISQPDGKDPEKLLSALAAHRVSRIVLVPSLLGGLLDMHTALAGMLPHLKLWVSSGEALPVDVVNRFQEMLPGRTLLNLYGSSEVAADATHAEIVCHEHVTGIPIGKPISNIQVYVLDQQFKPVPIGIAGDLYVSGAGLARGYLGHPDMTAERFVPNPFSHRNGERMYRTGDRVRWAATGELEFLGRNDHQVKIRGNRVELGEIEATLREHEAVEFAVAILREDEPGDQRLAAYFTARAEAQAPQAEELRNYLRQRLPEYMVPNAFVAMDGLPLTVNGKIDRARLPNPGQQAETAIGAPPRDELELQLAIIWQELLKVPVVGRKQSFFDLGGHSLLAIPLMKKIKRVLGEELPLYVLFQEPTVERLAAVLRSGHGPQRKSNLVPIQRHGAKPPLFFVHATGGGPLDYMALSRLLGQDKPFYGFQALDDQEITCEPFFTVEQRAQQYIAAMRQEQPHGPYLLGGWSFGAYVAYEMACQLRGEGEDVPSLILLDVKARTPKDLPDFPDDAEFLLHFANFQGLNLTSRPELGSEDRMQSLIDQLKRSDILPAETHISQVRTWVQAVRKRERSLCSYQPKSYDGSVTLLRAEDDGLFMQHDLDPADLTQGWGQIVSGDVQVYFVPGNHLTMLSPGNLERIAETIKTVMDKPIAPEPVMEPAI